MAGIDLNWLYLLMGLLIGPAVPPVTFALTWYAPQRLICPCAGALSCIFNAAGIDLNWLFLLMGLMIGPAVPPVTFCLTWSGLSYSLCHQSCQCLDCYVCGLAHKALHGLSRPCSAVAAASQPRSVACALFSSMRSCRNKATRAGAVSGALSGISCGLTAWLVYAKVPCPCAHACKSCRLPPGCQQAGSLSLQDVQSLSLRPSQLPGQRNQCAGIVQVAYGAITVATTGENNPLLAGSICSIGISAIVCTAVSPGTLLRNCLMQHMRARKRTLHYRSTDDPSSRLPVSMSSTPAHKVSAPAMADGRRPTPGPGQGLFSLVASLLRTVHAQVSLIFPQPPYDYKSMREIHMAEGDPRAGITGTGIDSPQGIEDARKVSRFRPLALPSLALELAGWHHRSTCILAQAMHLCIFATLSDNRAYQDHQ